jgi:hypothetical protein
MGRGSSLPCSQEYAIFPYLKPDQSSSLPRNISVRSILVFFSHLHLGGQSGLFPSGSTPPPTKNQRARLFFPMHATCPPICAQRRSRGIPPPSLNLFASWWWVVNAMPRLLYPPERGSIYFTGGWVAPGPVWMGAEKKKSFAPVGHWTPNYPPVASDYASLPLFHIDRATLGNVWDLRGRLWTMKSNHSHYVLYFDSDC